MSNRSLCMPTARKNACVLPQAVRLLPRSFSESEGTIGSICKPSSVHARKHFHPGTAPRFGWKNNIPQPVHVITLRSVVLIKSPRETITDSRLTDGASPLRFTLRLTSFYHRKLATPLPPVPEKTAAQPDGNNAR